MKKALLILTTGFVLGASVWLGSAHAAPVSGIFTRLGIFSPPVGSGCRTSVAASGLRVQFDSNLNTGGANVHVVPFAGCTLRQANHQSQLVTACFDGFTWPLQVRNGTPNISADILQDCSARLGGKQSMWYLNAP